MVKPSHISADKEEDRDVSLASDLLLSSDCLSSGETTVFRRLAVL